MLTQVSQNRILRAPEPAPSAGGSDPELNTGKTKEIVLKADERPRRVGDSEQGVFEKGWREFVASVVTKALAYAPPAFFTFAGYVMKDSINYQNYAAWGGAAALAVGFASFKIIDLFQKKFTQDTDAMLTRAISATTFEKMEAALTKYFTNLEELARAGRVPGILMVSERVTDGEKTVRYNCANLTERRPETSVFETLSNVHDLVVKLRTLISLQPKAQLTFAKLSEKSKTQRLTREETEQFERAAAIANQDIRRLGLIANVQELQQQHVKELGQEIGEALFLVKNHYVRTFFQGVAYSGMAALAIKFLTSPY